MQVDIEPVRRLARLNAPQSLPLSVANIAPESPRRAIAFLQSRSPEVASRAAASARSKRECEPEEAEWFGRATRQRKLGDMRRAGLEALLAGAAAPRPPG